MEKTTSSLILQTLYVWDVERRIKWQVKYHSDDKKGYLEAVYRKKQREHRSLPSVNRIPNAELVKTFLGEVLHDTSSLVVPITIQDRVLTIELDTATTGNLISLSVWKQLWEPKMDDVRHRYESASKHDLPVLRAFMDQNQESKDW